MFTQDHRKGRTCVQSLCCEVALSNSDVHAGWFCKGDDYKEVQCDEYGSFWVFALHACLLIWFVCCILFLCNFPGVFVVVVVVVCFVVVVFALWSWNDVSSENVTMSWVCFFQLKSKPMFGRQTSCLKKQLSWYVQTQSLTAVTIPFYKLTCFEWVTRNICLKTGL